MTSAPPDELRWLGRTIWNCHDEIDRWWQQQLSDRSHRRTATDTGPDSQSSKQRRRSLLDWFDDVVDRWQLDVHHRLQPLIDHPRSRLIIHRIRHVSSRIAATAPMRHIRRLGRQITLRTARLVLRGRQLWWGVLNWLDVPVLWSGSRLLDLAARDLLPDTRTRLLLRTCHPRTVIAGADVLTHRPRPLAGPHLADIVASCNLYDQTTFSGRPLGSRLVMWRSVAWLIRHLDPTSDVEPLHQAVSALPVGAYSHVVHCLGWRNEAPHPSRVPLPLRLFSSMPVDTFRTILGHDHDRFALNPLQRQLLSTFGRLLGSDTTTVGTVWPDIASCPHVDSDHVFVHDLILELAAVPIWRADTVDLLTGIRRAVGYGARLETMALLRHAGSKLDVDDLAEVAATTRR